MGRTPLQQKPGLAQQSQAWAQHEAPLQVFFMPAPVPISSLCFLVVPGCQKGRPAPGPHPSPKTSQAGCLALAPPSLPLRVNLDLGFIGPREPQVPFPGDKHPLADRFFLEGRESEQRPNFTTSFPQQRAATAHSPGIPGGWGRRGGVPLGRGMNWLQVIRTLAWMEHRP